MIMTYIIKIQSRNLIYYHRLLAMIPKNKDRIIQPKIIPVQVQIFWAWTGIGIVRKNIGSMLFRMILSMIMKEVMQICLKFSHKIERCRHRRSLSGVNPKLKAKFLWAVKQCQTQCVINVSIENSRINFIQHYCSDGPISHIN